MSRPRLLLSLALALACVSASTGCVVLSPDQNALTNVVGPPYGDPFNSMIAADPQFPSEYFKPLGLLLGNRCGSLDCHGQVGRNFRLYSQFGLRLTPDDAAAFGCVPPAAGFPMNAPGSGPVTACEIEADYRSACGLEPELMSQVVTQGGAAPDRLTLVRKPRLEENHKGGKLFTVGDDQDTCMLSWLGSNIDKTACANAVAEFP